jgi:plastocyanin
MWKLLINISITALITLNTVFAGDITGTIKAIGVKHSGNAIIYIEKIEGKTFEAPKDHAVIDQKNLTFIPHVLPIVAGTIVDFLNSDDVLHNVFTPDKCAEKFNLGTWPKGEKRSFTFNNIGCTPVLLCNVHPEMEAFVVVLQNPYFAVSKMDGTYTIKGVPTGKYTLTIWHENLKSQSVEIAVPEKGSVIQDFVIKR